jgi:hypothetical protein
MSLNKLLLVDRVMPTPQEVRQALIACLVKHEQQGTLNEQTPSLLREQVAETIGESVEHLKDDIKKWITEFVDDRAELRNANAAENDRPVNRERTPRGKKNIKRRETSSSSSSEFASSSSDGSDHETAPDAHSAAQLRSIAKMLGVPPSFWSNINKDDAHSLAEKLEEFCDLKKIKRAGDIPTVKESKKYKALREAAVELEGINQANIIEPTKRRCRDNIRLF